MIAIPSSVSTPAIEWTIDSILIPALYDLHNAGQITIPGRYASPPEAIEAMTVLFRAQLDMLRAGQKQTLSGLSAGTRRGTHGAPYAASKLHELLATILDWRGLIDDLRLRESDRGRVPLDDSVITVKSAPWQASGPNVFPACSPALPSQVEEALKRLGRLPASSAPENSPAIDSSIYLVETGRGWTQVLRVEGMPEGTKWDPAEYEEDLREVVAQALELQAGSRYAVSTDEILRGAILSFFANVKAAGRGGEMPRPIESGWLSSGPRGQRFRFLGGELDLIRLLQKLGAAPFFDLPRTLVDQRPYPRARHLVPTPHLPTIPTRDCSVVLDDGREIPGVRLPWAAQVVFGSSLPTRETQGVFRLVASMTTEMGGADPDLVEYAVTNARVGKLGSSKRFTAGLIVRNGPEGLSGWGVPGQDFSDELAQREAIQQAEEHVARMRPEGLFQEAVTYAQDRGVQTMGLTLSDHKLQREGLILAADVLLTRAHLGI